MLWRVGKGVNINIWDDPWVLNGDRRFISTAKVDGLNFVCDLIDFGSMVWDTNVVNENFNEQDAQAILAIPLSERLPEDRVAWAFTKNGAYSVKTAYMIGKSGNLDLFHQVWVKLWGLQVSPKVRHFFWRILSSTLPVRAVLKHRHILDDDTCPLCNEGPETIRHALLTCPRVSEV